MKPLLLLFFMLFAILPTHAKVIRPPNTEAAWVEKLSELSPQKVGDHWWVVTWNDGRKERLQVPPKNQKGIKSVRWHVNDLERGITSMPNGGALIQLTGKKTVTYVYPAFWTGQAWLLEGELKQKAPEAYRAVLIVATRQHRAIIALRRELQDQIGLIDQQVALENIKLDYQKPGLSAQEKDYLKRRYKHTQTMIASYQRMLANPHPVKKVFPLTLVRTYFFSEEIERLKKRIEDQQAYLQKIHVKFKQASASEKPRLQLTLWQLEQGLNRMNGMLAKFQETEQAFKSSGALLQY